LSGKTIDGVIKSARLENIPVVALCGMVELSEDVKKKLGLAQVVSVSKNITDIKVAMDTAYENVMKSAFEFGKNLS
ncbi:MAG: glycerate kinase, partial [Eudoraea sp.]|nr:glycerate kinase [Eudoraea sp.]